MSSDQSQPRLAFLLSQPRAGSTMTQKILGSHTRVHTQAEPWILLHPFHSLRLENIVATYNQKVNVRGSRAFISSLPGGERQYWRELGNAYSRMYGAILAEEGKEIFLDKTPRYYLIAEDLRLMFPDCVVICLVRNPMAVLSSIISTWARSKLYTLCRYRQDLLEAPGIFKGLMEAPQDNTIFLKYEDLVVNPALHIGKICEMLRVPFEPEMVDYKRETVFALGDRKSVDHLGGPDASLQNSWISGLVDPQVWRLQSEYFEILGEDTFASLGYDPAAIAEAIKSNRPSAGSLQNTVSLDVLLDDQRDALFGVHRLHREVEALRRDMKGRSDSLEYTIGSMITSPMRRIRRIFGDRRNGE